jgi:hypothetical protein
MNEYLLCLVLGGGGLLHQNPLSEFSFGLYQSSMSYTSNKPQISVISFFSETCLIIQKLAHGIKYKLHEKLQLLFETEGKII